MVLLENIKEFLYLRFPVVTPNLARNGEKSWFITKDRVIDANLKKQIEKKTLYICGKHYEFNMMIVNPNKTTLKLGSIATVTSIQQSGVYLAHAKMEPLSTPK